MNLQGLLDRVVSDHRASLATLRYDVERAIPKVAEKWRPWFDDARDIHGSAFCTDVRLVVLRMRELRGPMRGDTLLTSCGSGLSVQVSDCRGWVFGCGVGRRRSCMGSGCARWSARTVVGSWCLERRHRRASR